MMLGVAGFSQRFSVKDTVIPERLGKVDAKSGQIYKQFRFLA